MPGHVRARKDANGKVRKRADGSTIWQARWRHPDNPTHRRETNKRTKREAERWITEQESSAMRGAYADPRKGKTGLPALADALRATWGDLEPKTRAGYEAILARWIVGDADPLRPGKPCRFRDLNVAGIDTAYVQTFINDVSAVRAPNTVRRIYGVLNALLRLAAQRGYIALNPCDAVKIPSKKRVGVRRSHLYLEGSELRALADAMDHYRTATYLAGSCGLRAGELWALRRRDVDLLHAEVSVRYALKEINSSHLPDELKGLQVGPPKSAASRRRISLPGGLVQLLEPHDTPKSPRGYAVARALDADHCELGWGGDHADPDCLLFTTPNGYPVRHNMFYKRVFRPAVQHALPARLARLRWHDMRHTAAALSLAANPNLALVKDRLGHENIATTVDLYGKRVPSVDAALADAVGASIFAPTETNVVPLRPAEKA